MKPEGRRHSTNECAEREVGGEAGGVLGPESVRVLLAEVRDDMRVHEAIRGEYLDEGLVDAREAGERGRCL